jgi:hypothetical protein
LFSPEDNEVEKEEDEEEDDEEEADAAFLCALIFFSTIMRALETSGMYLKHQPSDHLRAND